MYEATKDRVQWLLVYICEAHADDEWPIGAPVTIKQHKTIEERDQACRSCLDTLGCGIPTVLDSMENSFNDTYACWPLRFYLIDNNIVEHVPMPKGGAYNPLELDNWIKLKLGV